VYLSARCFRRRRRRRAFIPSLSLFLSSSRLCVCFVFVLKRSALVQSENRMKKKIFFLCFPFFAKKKGGLGCWGLFTEGREESFCPKSLSL